MIRSEGIVKKQINNNNLNQTLLSKEKYMRNGQNDKKIKMHQNKQKQNSNSKTKNLTCICYKLFLALK